MKRFLLSICGIVLAIPILFVLALLFWPRPPDLTPASIFEGDTRIINYCELPVLDGSGLLANDFPQGHTPNCGYQSFPMPILAGCTEPLAEGATDMRGLWLSEPGPDARPPHVERIEQCGNRFVVTTLGVVHDLTTDGSLSGSSNDVRPLKVGGMNFCIRTTATTQWIDGRLQFYALGLVPVVNRYLENGQLKWNYPNRGTTTFNRICELPSD